MAESVHIRGIRKADFDFLVRELDRWWGGPSGQRAHPIFFYEFGEHALIAEQDGQVVGFLLGFITVDLGYVHLVGIEPEHRRMGVGQALYQRFEERCRAAGVRRIKAIAAIGNEGSVAFHRALGFEVRQEADYAGPGRGRVVFTKSLQ